MCKQIYKISRQQFNLHWRKSDELVSAFIDKYNQGQPLGSQLRAAHWELAKLLVRTYSKQLSYHQAYAAKLTPHESVLPTLRTNNTYLADELKCSERKVRYLRSRLKQAGFITSYVYHGQNAQYELELAPSCLYLQQNNQGDNVIDWFLPQFQALRKAAMQSAGNAPQPPKKQASAPPSSLGPDANFATYSNQLHIARTLNYILSGSPVEQAPENQSFTEKETVSDCGRDVEKLKKPVQKPNQEIAQERNENSEAGNPHDQANSGAAKPDAEGVAPATKGFVVPQTAPKTLGQALAHLPKGLRDRLRNQISILWLYAEDVLYSDKYLEPEEIEAGKACLAEYFCYSNPARWSSGNNEVMRRMMLVKLWIERGERVGIQRFVPIPGSYFDVRKPHGFSQTKSWYKADQVEQELITDRVQFSKACKEYLRSTEQGAKQSTVDVYKKWQQRLGKRSPELLNKFHKYILNVEQQPDGAAA